MADSPKNTSSGGRKAPTKATSRKPQTTRPEAPTQRRTLSKHQREERQQRLIITATASVLGVAALLVIGTLIYFQFIVPTFAVARVGDTTLSQGDYWEERRLAYANEIAQNLQLLAFFGGDQQISGQFAGRSPGIDQLVRDVRKSDIEDRIVDEWIDRQIIARGAAELGVQVTDAEVDQQIVAELGMVFLPSPPVTSTEELTATSGISATAVVENVEAVTGTETLTPTAEVAPELEALTPTVELTPTAAETPTPPPTSTAAPTPEPAVAADQAEQIIEAIYLRYKLELDQVNQSPALSQEDLRLAMAQDYRDRALRERLQEQLVPEAEFTLDTEPDRVQASHILIAVDASEDISGDEREALYDEAKREAEEIRQELLDGADFAGLAAERSNDPGSAEGGGDLGYFDVDGRASNGSVYVPEVVAAAFALESDEISEPVRTQFGWHIITVTDRETASLEDQLREARSEALDSWIGEKRVEFVVQRFPEPTATVAAPTTVPLPTEVPTYLPGPPTPLPTVTPTATIGSDVLTPEPDAP